MREQDRILRYLPQEEKERSRALYEEMFPEDGPAYTDAYYRIKGACNRILVLEEQGKLISMLHLNPYRFWMRGELTDANYVVAVATRPQYRHQGCMRALLTRALGDLYEERQPFAFLMPASEAIYRPFGFRWMGNEDFRELSAMPPERLSEACDLFVWKDAAYFEQQVPEEEWEHTPMMVRIVYLPGLLRKIGLQSGDSCSLFLRVTDELLPGNAGLFRWVLKKDGSYLEKAASEPEERECLSTDAAGLGSFLFGAESAAEAFPAASPEILAKLEKIRVFQKIFLHEVV